MGWPARLARWSTVVFVAWRNLAGERRRWVVGTVAVAVAAMLVLVLRGAVAWVESSATAYLDNSGADLVVLQRGIDNLLLSQSVVSAGVVADLARVPGVASASPVITVSGVGGTTSTALPVLLVGATPGHAGGPWQLADGRAPRFGNEAALDRGLAHLLGAGVGSDVNLFGQHLHVVGLSTGSNAAGIFFVFTPLQVAQRVTGSTAASDVLVRLAPGYPATEVQDSIDQIIGVHALTRDQLSANDLRMVDASFAQPIVILVAIGSIVGVLVSAIVLYSATVEHRRDYAVLQAVGAAPAFLAAAAVIQSLLLTAGGVALGLLLTMGIAAAFDAWEPVIEVQLSPLLVLGTVALLAALNLLAAFLPIRHLQRIDPQEVFKA